MLNSSIDFIVSSVYDVMYNDAYSNHILKKLSDNNVLIETEKSYITAVSFGVIENWIRLNYYLEVLSKKKAKKKVAIIILAAMYEIEFMKHNKNHLTVNAYVAYTSKKYPYAKNFVNAVLREFIRRDNILEYTEDVKGLSRFYSHPENIVALLIDQYGLELAIKILQKNQEQKPLYLRVNHKKVTRNDLIKLLVKEGFDIGLETGCDNSIMINSLPKNISSYESFQKGYYYIQDISSIAMINAVELYGHERVLDVCAAPGGKALGIAERLTTGSIVAEDVSEAKLPRILENAKRLGLSIEVNHADATVYNSDYFEKFDVVVADLPCSGLGVISKKPEIKYRNSSQKLKDMVQLQGDILENVCKYVKVGGSLYYSTCTINVDENEHRVEQFVKEHPNFQILSVKTCLWTGDPFLKLLQSDGFSDGFFITRFKRIG